MGFKIFELQILLNFDALRQNNVITYETDLTNTVKSGEIKIRKQFYKIYVRF
jgi:hypothetical protein